jgi:hypothetical protein
LGVLAAGTAEMTDMALPRAVIVRLVRERLEQRPGSTRAHAAAAIGIDRHTLVRALEAGGTSFEAEQDAARLRTYRAVHGMLLTRRQIAIRLEFASVRTLRAWERRMGLPPPQIWSGVMTRVHHERTDSTTAAPNAPYRSFRIS